MAFQWTSWPSSWPGKNALAVQHPRVLDLRLQGLEVRLSESLLSVAAV